MASFRGPDGFGRGGRAGASFVAAARLLPSSRRFRHNPGAQPMGGEGSGHWGKRGGKVTVEDCLALDSAALARAGALVPVPGVGSLVWSDAVTGERTASIACGRLVLDGRVVPCLLYAATGPDGSRRGMEELLPLEQTHPPVGGGRWWFPCPLGAGEG